MANKVLFFYLLTCPIYWLPGLDPIFIKYFKITLISFVFLLFALRYKFTFIIPREGKHLFLVLVIWSFPFLWISYPNHEISMVVIYYLNYFFGLFALVFSYSVYDKLLEAKSAYRILFFLVSIISILPITNFLYNIPDITSPFSDSLDYEELGYFWSTGFHGSRTGWSIALSQFIPLGLLFISRDYGRGLKIRKLFYFLLVLTPIFGAQIVCMGRGGLFSSAISILIIIYKYFDRKVFFTFLSSLILIMFIYSNDILIALRFASDDGRSFTIEEATSSRDVLIKQAPELIFESPVFGNGFKGSARSSFGIAEFGESLEVHNVFIRIIVDHGVIFSMVMIFFIFSLIVLAIRVLWKNDAPTLVVVASCIILSGVFSANFEPNTIFGNFQNLPLWWFSAGLLLKYSEGFNPKSQRGLNKINY